MTTTMTMLRSICYMLGNKRELNSPRNPLNIGKAGVLVKHWRSESIKYMRMYIPDCWFPVGTKRCGEVTHRTEVATVK